MIEQHLEALSCNSDVNQYPSSTTHLCRYLAENYEDEFMTTGGGSSLTFSGQMLSIETASMMNDVGLNISQLCLFLKNNNSTTNPK